MTDSVTIGGLHYLVGQSVAAFIGGLDCGDYIVDPYGQIAVPMGADPDGYFGPTYLSLIDGPGEYGDAEIAIQISEDAGTFTVYVPAVIGLTYLSRGRIPRPVQEAEIKSSKGPGLGKTKRAHLIGALFQDTGGTGVAADGVSNGLELGTDFSKMLPAVLRDDAGLPLPAAVQFSGAHLETLNDGYTLDTMACWQISRPYSLVVCQFGPFLNSEDE